jgi:hypothetical protein
MSEPESVVVRAMTTRIDRERWKRAQVTERAEMARLQSLLETWPTRS